jgi:RNA polymerase sigma-70 factor, ECF subfamily
MEPKEYDDPAFLARLRAGDQAAYRTLVHRFHRSLIHVAQSVIGSYAQAEEVVQDTWAAVFSGIGRFEGRSSLGTWLFTIALNRARSRAARENRLVAFPTESDGASDRAVPLSAFTPDGHWVDAPRLWEDLDPERIVAGRQLWQHVQAEIEKLPPGQRAVLVLRDIEGQAAEDACALLTLTPENQRVLLHRARTRIRQAIDVLTQEPQATARGVQPAVHPRRRPGLERIVLERIVAALRQAITLRTAACRYP